MADDPVQLLGVVAIHEFHRPQEFREYWWKIDEPRLYDSIPSTPPDYVPVWKKSD